MRKSHYFESKLHYLKVTCAVENPKIALFERGYLKVNCSSTYRKKPEEIIC